jgi:HlyD family secretion protein
VGKSRKWLLVAVPVLALTALGAILTVHSRGPDHQAFPETPNAPTAGSIGCLGRIEPKDGVIRVAAPYFESRPALVRELLVKEGDWVKNGQPLAILDGKPKLEAGAAQADAQVLVARRKLEQVNAGAKPADIAAQKAEISRWESVLENVRKEYQRYETLYATHDVSGADLDGKRMSLETTVRAIDQAKSKLRSLEEVRQTDVATAESELQVAVAESQRAHASLAAAMVRAPIDGQVLKIETHPGEEVGPQGLLKMGRTDQMYVVAEVYETDIGRVKVGAPAVVTSDLFSGTLQGKVERIEKEISKGEVLPSDTVAYADSRVVKVKVLLSDPGTVVGLINGKVSVLIQP